MNKRRRNKTDLYLRQKQQVFGKIPIEKRSLFSFIHFQQQINVDYSNLSKNNY